MTCSSSHSWYVSELGAGSTFFSPTAWPSPETPSPAGATPCAPEQLFLFPSLVNSFSVVVHTLSGFNREVGRHTPEANQMEQGSEEDPKEENEIQGLFVLHEQCGLGAKGVCPRLHLSPGAIT